MPTRRPKQKTRKAPAQIHRFSVTLMDVEPPVTRVIEIGSDATLDRLHDVLQAAFGWTNSHLHEFSVNDRRYATPIPEDEVGAIDEREVTVAEVALARGEPLRYIYDMGDCWDHRLVVEKVGPPEPGATYPRCVSGARAAPPEDSGGGGGYERLLEILDDPKHEEHDAMAEWAGEFDPEAFEVERVNKELRRLT